MLCLCVEIRGEEQPVHKLRPGCVIFASPFRPRGSANADSSVALDASLSSEQRDPLRQRFSVAPHPRLPLLLISDGYMVTVLQVPGQLSCVGLMQGLVTECSHQLKSLKETRCLQVKNKSNCRFSDVNILWALKAQMEQGIFSST